jgi:hypothetical protein
VVRVENQGPLLTFHNVSSGTSSAVVLKELDRGRLEVYRFRDGKPNGRIRTWKNGRARAPISEYGFYGFVFELDWAVKGLEEMLKGEDNK